MIPHPDASLFSELYPHPSLAHIHMPKHWAGFDLGRWSVKRLLRNAVGGDTEEQEEEKSESHFNTHWCAGSENYDALPRAVV